MENLRPVDQRQSPELDRRLVEEEDKEEPEQTEVGRDPSLEVVEVEEEDPRVMEARSQDLARLPALGEMLSPVWEPVRR